MKILFFPQGNYRMGGARMTVFQVADFLKARVCGGMIENMYLFELKKRLDYFLYIWSHDALFCQKRSRFLLFHVWFAKLIGKKVVFELEDYPFDDEAEKRKVVRILKRCDVVIPASHYLQELVDPYCSKSVIVPVSISLDKIAPKPARYASKLIIGWVGNARQAEHQEDLLALLEYIKKLDTPEFAHVTFRIVGIKNAQNVIDAYSTLEHITTEFLFPGWAEEDEFYNAIAALDIGVVPLKDNEINRSKCISKLLQMMASGVVVVADGVGENKYIIDGSVNGVIVPTRDDWPAVLGKVMREFETYKGMGEKAKAKIVAEFEINKNSAKIQHLVDALYTKQ